MKKTVVVGICGASGALYAIRLVKALLEHQIDIHLVISKSGKTVLEHEAGYKGGAFADFLRDKGIEPGPGASLTEYENDNFFAPFASGSFRYDAMVIAPCSMGTLAAVGAGLADKLIHRAADVCLKERQTLILLPRETPLNAIHIENMLKVLNAGAIVMPPCPSFYSAPETIEDLVDTVIARVLDHIGVVNSLVKRWSE